MRDIQKTLLYIAYNLSNVNQVITIDAIRQPLEWLNYADIELEKEMSCLVENGYLYMTSNREFLLSAVGVKEAYEIDKVRTWDDFNRLIRSGMVSTAYLDYCEEVYGYRMPLFNAMDK